MGVIYSDGNQCSLYAIGWYREQDALEEVREEEVV